MVETIKRQGFTLIELLVVIGIIALLSTIAVFSLNSARAKARDARRFADVKQVQTALELYYDNSSDYPAPESTSGTILGGSSAECLSSGDPSQPDTGGFSASCVGTDYMRQVPADPLSTNQEYIYNASGDKSTYVIQFETEGPVGGFQQGYVCATPAGMQPGSSSGCSVTQ